MYAKLILAIAGTAMMGTSIAAAQPAEDRRERQDERRERMQDRQDRARDRMEDRRSDDGTQSWFDEYFGESRSQQGDLAKLRDLAGVWRIEVTRYMPEGDLHGTDTTTRDRTGTDRNERDETNPNRTIRDNDRDNRNRDNTAMNTRKSTGFAERRWALGGTLLVERYTLDGSSMNDLPLRSMDDLRRSSGLRSGTTLNERTDRDWQNNNDQNRDRADRNTNDPNRTNPNTDPNRTDPNRTDRERTGNQPLTDRNTTDRRTGDQGMSDWSTQAKGPGTEGLVLWGYDQADQKFNVVWTDSSHSALRYDEGEMDDQGRITLSGKYEGPDGEEYDTRTVIHIQSPSRQTLTMYKDEGLMSEEVKVMEIVYTKANDIGQEWTRATTD